MIDLSCVKNETIIIRHGKYYGCLKDKNGNTIKKGFEDREEARLWINDKSDYKCRWTE